MARKLKQVLIIGKEMNNAKVKEIKDIYSDEELLIIDNNKGESSQHLLPLYHKKIDSDTRIDIQAHGGNLDGDHNVYIDEAPIVTALYVYSLSSLVHSPLYIHLWSCFGGAANKDLSYLPDGSILITHAESNYSTYQKLDGSLLLNGVEKYKEHKNKFQSFLDNIHTESIQSATFNIKLKGKIERFTINPSIEDIENFIAIKHFLETQVSSFSKWYNLLESKYKQDFPEIFPVNTLTLPNIGDNNIKEFLLGNFVYNCLKGSKEFVDFLKSDKSKYILLDKESFLSTNLHIDSPLLVASGNGHAEIVEEILQHKADPNLAERMNGSTPLYVATQDGYTAVVKTLLRYGAKPNLANNQGVAPLYMASGEGYTEIVETLLQYKAAPNLATYRGVTPLLIASQNGHKETVKTLLQYQANPDLDSNEGFTPLLIAIQNGHRDTVEILLQYKADPNLCDNHGFTPLHMATQQGYIEIARALLQYKADPNLANNQGITPLLISAFNSNIESAILLLKHGANIDTAKELANNNNLENVIEFLDKAIGFSQHFKDNIVVSEDTDIMGEGSFDNLHDEL